MNLPQSSLKVPYDLRPSKQIERRMIIDLLNCFQSQNYEIRDYQYVGFGSVYFVDFVLFHKLLFIRDMLSIEGDGGMERRVRFNLPYNFIKVKISMSRDALPYIDRAKKTILWLDYDLPLSSDTVQDCILASSMLQQGSFIFVTIDARPPEKFRNNPEDWSEYYYSQAKDYFEFNWTKNNFTQQNIASSLSQILFNSLNHGIRGRSNIKRFAPLVNFNYTDGTPMISVGGMIASAEDLVKIEGMQHNGNHLRFLRLKKDMPPYVIRFPKLTRKERIYLDYYMEYEDGWMPPDFDLPNEFVSAYKELYKYYPNFAELLF